MRPPVYGDAATRCQEACSSSAANPGPQIRKSSIAVPRRIPFNQPPITGNERSLIEDAIARRELSGDGYFSKRCEAWLSQRLCGRRTLLTHSCTAALEMAAILADLQPGDEVITPSFTFTSTANAIVLRNAVPVFVDIRPDTLNIDETLVEAAITKRTKAIFVVHYAGVCAEMDAFQAIAAKHRLLLIEDAAQALLSTYHGRPAGALADAGCISFHASKNVVSGEGGALIINSPDLGARAEIIREKGTNRSRFLRGQVDKYSWVDVGSSYAPSELVAAFLYAQLEAAEPITEDRLNTWRYYHAAFADLETSGIDIRRPVVPEHCRHNGHMYYLLMPDGLARDGLICALREKGIDAPFHYIPLHSSEAGRKFGRTSGTLHVTDRVSERLIRLPLWYKMDDERDRVIESVYDFCGRVPGRS